MRKIIPILILLIPSMVFAASFVDDEFSGDLSSWTQSGNGTIITDGGYLSITSSDGAYDAVTQANITGEFDLVARMKDAFYPSEIPDASYQCAFLVYIDENNYVTGYQNRAVGEGQNEIMLLMLVNGSQKWLNPPCDPLEYVCIRVARDSDNYFYLYKNALADCSGDWTELNPSGLRLQSAAGVSISIRAKAPEASTTYLTDYIRTFGSEPPTPKTLEGGTLQGISIQ